MNDATEHQIKQMSEQASKGKSCTQHKNQGDKRRTTVQRFRWGRLKEMAGGGMGHGLADSEPERQNQIIISISRLLVGSIIVTKIRCYLVFFPTQYHVSI